MSENEPRAWDVTEVHVREEREVRRTIGGCDPIPGLTSVHLSIEIKDVWTFLPNSYLHSLIWPGGRLKNVLVMGVDIPSAGKLIPPVTINAQLVAVGKGKYGQEDYDMPALENLMRYLRANGTDVKIEEQES